MNKKQKALAILNKELPENLPTIYVVLLEYKFGGLEEITDLVNNHDLVEDYESINNIKLKPNVEFECDL